MEIKPVKPLPFEPEYGRGRIANRPAGAAPPFPGASPVDEVAEFSLNVLLRLADEALAKGDPATAREQYLKVLQYDPANSRGLYGRIVAEGMQPPANLTATLGRLETLLETLPDAERQELLRRAGRDLLTLGQKAETEALAEFFREITPSSFERFAFRMEQVLLFYQNSAALVPSHEGMLLAMITAAERLLVPYRDRKSGKKFHPSEGIYEKGKRWLQKARELLRKRFPNCFDRLRLYRKYQTCFIATAVWGDPLAGEVEAFRSFRDLYLRTNSVGRRFIVQYYRFGPLVAALVGERPLLKSAARTVLTLLLRGIGKLPGVRVPPRQGFRI